MNRFRQKEKNYLSLRFSLNKSRENSLSYMSIIEFFALSL